MIRSVLSALGALAAGGLLSLALIGAPSVVRADDDTKPQQESFQDAIKRMEQMFEKMERRGGFAFPEGFGPAMRLRANAGQPRLGVEVSTPSAALADQLDLPKGQGLVVRGVKPNSPADKAGLKEHDILLELNGQPVPDQVAAFVKLVAKVEANKPTKATVMRKGRKTTVEGLSLPEAKPAERAELPGLPDLRLPEDFRGLPPGGPGHGNATTLTRKDDSFNVTHKDGKVTVTVNGKIAGGKTSVEKVTIDDGEHKKSYDAVSEVPADHRERVNKLIRLAEGGKVQKE